MRLHMVHADQRLVQCCSQCLGCAGTDTKASGHTWPTRKGDTVYLRRGDVGISECSLDRTRHVSLMGLNGAVRMYASEAFMNVILFNDDV